MAYAQNMRSNLGYLYSLFFCLVEPTAIRAFTKIEQHTLQPSPFAPTVPSQGIASCYRILFSPSILKNIICLFLHILGV